MPRVTHFPSSGDRWAFVVTSCPVDYFLKCVLTVHLANKAIVLRLTEKEKETPGDIGTWVLKQIKATSTCPTYMCKLPSNEKQRPQPGRIDYIAHMELRYTARGFYIFQERIFQDIPCTYDHLDLAFQPKGIPHILEQALCAPIQHK